MATTTMQLDHHHFGRAPDDPSFDLDKARAAHADVMARWDDPKEGDAFKAMLLHTINEATAEQIAAHRKEIQKFLDTFAIGQRGRVGKAIVRAYVDASVSAAQEVSKKKRAWHEQDWKRNHGQFSSFVGSVGQGQAPATDWTHARQQSTSAASYGQYAQVLNQAAQIAAASGKVGMSGQDVEFRIADKKGNIRTARGAKPGQLPGLKRGEKVIDIKGAGIAGDHLTMGQSAFNLVQALGVPSGAAARAGQVVGAGNTFAHAWDAHQHENYGSETGKAYARIKSGATALHTIAGGNPKAQVAVAVGRFVGDHGPDAEKVLGPKARKKGYQYRGVERAPRDLPKVTPNEDKDEQAREHHDRLVGRISRHIPTRSVHNLNLASGYTAPSHGYLLDGSGRPKLEAHGYGDDHYLPFKLSGLHKLRNGSYIRTRSTGGPTTEDIYAASVSGAKSFTVASRQGTYTVGFDPEFTHNKRFGDIALGMSRRYGKILDAVASGKVRAHGEVKDAQFDEWYQNALKENTENNVPDAQAAAYKSASDKRTAQEGKEGRELSLDGEGYDYALQALQSQYPYYLKYQRRDPGTGAGSEKDPTGYYRPNEKRFQDVDEESGGHYERIGNRNETDRGYVKPRHIKASHAQVGYFDPDIAGETKDTHGQPTGSGKIAGDRAFYQNWAHNPYNPNQVRRPQRRDQTPGTSPTSGSGATVAGAGSVGNGIARNNVQQGNQTLTGAGQGRANFLTGDDPGTADLKSKIAAYYKHKSEAGEQMNADMAKWGANPDSFTGDYAANPKDVAATVNEHHGRVAAKLGLTNQPVNHADETPDVGDGDVRGQYNEAHTFLTSEYGKGLRNEVSQHAAGMYEADPDSFNGANPAENWWFYHNAPREALLDSVGAGNPAKRRHAQKLIEAEGEIDDLGAQLYGRDNYAEFDPSEEHVEEDAGAAAAAEHDAGAAGSTAARRHHADLHALLGMVHDHVASMKNSHEGDEVAVAHQLTPKIANAVHELGASDPEDQEANIAILRRLLEEHPGLGEFGVRDQQTGHRVHLKEFLLRPTHRDVNKRLWTVSKSGDKYVVKAA